MATLERPVISICDSSNREITSGWNVGTLDVNNGSDLSESEPKEFHIWNNRANSIDNAPDLISSFITTKNINGDNVNEQLVVDKWVQVSCKALSIDSDGDGTLDTVAIGGETYFNICADGASSTEKEKFVISGGINNGASSDTKNYSTVILKVSPKINALNGLHQFKIKITGYYM